MGDNLLEIERDYAGSYELEISFYNDQGSDWIMISLVSCSTHMKKPLQIISPPPNPHEIAANKVFRDSFLAGIQIHPEHLAAVIFQLGK